MFDEKAVAVAKIRAKVLHAARCWLDQNNYIEVHGPTLIPAVGDWPGYFEVKYFDKNAYLTQGLEPYSNVFLAGLGREFPIDSQTLFCKPHPQKSGVTFSVDLFPPEGYGEISSGAQVISEKKALRELMTEENIDVGDQEWQLALMQDCPDSHSAFAIGIERLIQWICRLKNIREASAFPRALNDFYP